MPCVDRSGLNEWKERLQTGIRGCVPSAGSSRRVRVRVGGLSSSVDSWGAHRTGGAGRQGQRATNCRRKRFFLEGEEGRADARQHSLSRAAGACALLPSKKTSFFEPPEMGSRDRKSCRGRESCPWRLSARADRTTSILGISGASGSRLALRALRLFAGSPDVERLHLVVSPRALVVARDEVAASLTSVDAFVDAAGLDAVSRGRVVLHPESAIDAPISSGSYQTRGMAVLPCSAGTLASIAHGTSRGLLQRAADVCLKERRRLVLGLSETPLSLVHAENILAATRAGAIVAPARAGVLRGADGGGDARRVPDCASRTSSTSRSTPPASAGRETAAPRGREAVPLPRHVRAHGLRAPVRAPLGRPRGARRPAAADARPHPRRDGRRALGRDGVQPHRRPPHRRREPPHAGARHPGRARLRPRGVRLLRRSRPSSSSPRRGASTRCASRSSRRPPRRPRLLVRQARHGSLPRRPRPRPRDRARRGLDRRHGRVRAAAGRPRPLGPLLGRGLRRHLQPAGRGVRPRRGPLLAARPPRRPAGRSTSRRSSTPSRSRSSMRSSCSSTEARSSGRASSSRASFSSASTSS